MKVKDWIFTCYFTDEEDEKAKHKVLTKFLNLPEIRMGQAERDVHNFSAGFIRGMAWCEAKKENK